MSSSYEATGVLVLGRVTDVIVALFGAYNLDATYPGNGEAYFAKNSDKNEPTWGDVRDRLAQLAASMSLSLPAGATNTLEQYLQLFGQHFGVADDTLIKHLNNDVGFDEDETAMHDFLFEIALCFDDGHGLTALKLDSCWHSSKAHLYEFGGKGEYLSRHVDFSLQSTDALHFGTDMEKAISNNDPQNAAAAVMRKVKDMLESVRDETFRTTLTTLLATEIGSLLSSHDLGVMLRRRGLAVSLWDTEDVIDMIAEDAVTCALAEDRQMLIANTFVRHIAQALEDNLGTAGNAFIETHWEHFKAGRHGDHSALFRPKE